MTQDEFFEGWSLEAPELVAHTSGSTGKPKEIRLPGEIVIASARRTNRFFGITSESRLHVPLDFNYIAAKMMGVRTALAGATLTSEPPSNRPLCAPNIDLRTPIDLLAVVPSQVPHILDNLDSLPQIKAIIIGGGVIPEAIKDRVTASGLNAWETYGMTETASHIALRRVGEEWFETLEGVTVSTSEADCLVIDVDGRELTTNDIALLKDSRHFKIMGRADNVINTGGKKVYPEEVEKLLSTIWEGVEFAITSAPDDKWGERIVALIEDGGVLPAGELPAGSRRYCEVKALLPAHMVPKEIRFVERIPRTSNGKIDRKACRSLVN